MYNNYQSDEFPVVFVKISRININIFRDKKLLKAYVSDIYCGKKSSYRTFLSMIDAVPNSIFLKRKISVEEFSKIKFPDFEQIEQKRLRGELINCLLHIYVYDSFQFEMRNSKRGGTSSYAKKIIVFQTDKKKVFLGDEVTFSWELHNPAKLLFYYNRQSINVTNQNSIKLEVYDNDFYLFLFDENKTKIDKKHIKLIVTEPAYCINCGERFLEESDIYCIFCGTKKVE